ncbi:MAG: DMT family transporter [Gammaproteobacteria bacterium]|nr:DMT family transporter [Gammaproteobacteria bacterium]
MQLVEVYTRVVLATFFWGANFVLAVPVLHALSPFWAAAYRFLLAAMVLLLVSLHQGAALRTLLQSHFTAIIGIAGIGIVGFNLLFFVSMQYTSATNGALIMATNPLVTSLMAFIILAERPTLRQWVAVPLAFLGVIVVISDGHLNQLLTLQLSRGDVLMVLANLAWAIYNVLSRRYLAGVPALAVTTLLMGVGGGMLLLMALLSGERFTLPDAQAGSALAVMVLGGTVLAYWYWNAGIARLGAPRTALFMNFVPLFAVLVAALGGVAPSAAQMAGGVLVIGSVVVATLRRQT